MRHLAAAVFVFLLSAPFAASEDWDGGYGGFQLGYVDADTSGVASLAGDGLTGGVHVGYGFEFGDYVLGGEVDYDTANLSLGSGAAEISSVGRVKVRAGTGFGPTLVYGTAGLAHADTSLGDETGYFLGAGIGSEMIDGWVVGGEVLYHNFSDIDGSGVDASATSVGLRASFRF